MTAGGDEKRDLREFGRWRFDPVTGDLDDGETTVRLEPQVARLLDYFLSHQDVLISRDELMSSVWDERIVSDHAVNRCISILRHRLSPGDKNAYIETVVRRGFIAHFPPPAAGVTGPLPVPGGERSSRLDRRLAFGVIALLASLLLFGAIRMFGDSATPPGSTEPEGTPMVAVLPFMSDGLSGDSAFFANGMHDDLLTQLAQLESIRVISRTSVSEYRDSKMNIREIGRELGADALLEGGVQRVGDKIRINVQLIDAGSDTHLWAEQYDRELTPANIFEIQAEIARSIASAMHSALTLQDDQQLQVIPTENMAAYRAYHEAMELRATETISAPVYIARLERAVALDPGFVRAWAELAGALAFVNLQVRNPESIRRLESILERVRTLAPQSSDYLIAQSYYTYYILKDHDRAFELIKRAQKLRPSDPQVLELQSWIQRRQGDIDGMIETIRQVRQLDPRNPFWERRLVLGLTVAHRYDEALDTLDEASGRDFRLAALKSFLQVRDHRQPGRLIDDLLALETEFGLEADRFDLWEAYIAARDYDGAAGILAVAASAERSAAAWTVGDLLGRNLAGVITGRLRDPRAENGPAIDDLLARLEQIPEPGEAEPNADLVMAYLSAVKGDPAETERRVRAWFRGATRDLAEKLAQRHHACRALGLAAAARAAIECLEAGLAEPSQVHPFIEPLLPYYDSIRDEQTYVDFLAGLPGG